MVHMQHMRLSKRIACIMATVAIGLSGALIATTAVQASPTQNAQQAANTNSDVQVIAFQQTWNSIANECTDVYGPEGVGYVEISPATETITGTGLPDPSISDV